MTSSWGCRESRDVEILRSIGLRYRSYMCEADGDDRTFFQWEENEWQASDPIVPYEAITNFFDAEEVFSRHLISKIHRRMSGGFFDGSNYNKIIEENIDPETSNGPIYAERELGEKCNICECLFSEERYFVDGAVPGKGGWANMCVECFTDFKAQIGWGYGQLYKKLESGGWQRVAGGPLDEEE